MMLLNVFFFVLFFLNFLMHAQLLDTKQRLQTEIDNLTQKLQEKSEELEREKSKIDNLEKTIQTMDSQMMELTDGCNLIAGLNEKLDSALEQIEAQKREIEQQQEEIRDRNNQIMELQASLQESQQQAISMSQSAAFVKEKLKEKESEEAQQQLQGGSGADAGEPSPELLSKVKGLETQLIQVGSLLKTRELELDSERVDNESLRQKVTLLGKDIADRQAHYEKAIKAIEEIEKKESEAALLRSMVAQIKEELKVKDDQIESLKEVLIRDVPDDAKSTRLTKKNEVIQQLNASLEAKDKHIHTLYAQLLEATQEGLSSQVSSLMKTVAVLKRDLETKTKELEESDRNVTKLKKKYERAFNKGKLQQSGQENVELRFKLDTAEMKQKVAEGKLEKQIRKNKQLEERCEKIERALTNAKKVEFIERRFLEVLRIIESHKTENRGEFRSMIERVKKETEERKNVQTRFAILKAEYKRLTEGDLTIPRLQEEIEVLKEENTITNAKLEKLTKEYKVLARQKMLLEKELEEGGH
eukprot:TRINITY_DN1507_c0_g1_i2.p1 TRINITY_DN1507_c0_g1~~TRINITY_DN1507_c0_g1_i2.p1  ORF type:complete len:529 (+),score=178.81 TRINITY_DN1507_c0_g1_i2:1037-2623(+)